MTLAVAQTNIATRYVIADSFEGLARIWQGICEDPIQLADEYEHLWAEQHDVDDHYNAVREQFNIVKTDAAALLYLLARCVKNAPRFNAAGEFNQSSDRRRSGTHPDKMRRNIYAASALLAGKTDVQHAPAELVIARAQPGDLVYLDPPWQGTTEGKDKRYAEGFARDSLIAMLNDLNARGVPFVVSYDGNLSGRTYGTDLPETIDATLFSLDAGVSSQATLLGRSERTTESVYVSNTLVQDS